MAGRAREGHLGARSALEECRGGWERVTEEPRHLSSIRPQGRPSVFLTQKLTLPSLRLPPLAPGKSFPDSNPDPPASVPTVSMCTQLSATCPLPYPLGPGCPLPFRPWLGRLQGGLQPITGHCLLPAGALFLDLFSGAWAKHTPAQSSDLRLSEAGLIFA